MDGASAADMINDDLKYKTPYLIRLYNKKWRDKNKGYFRIHRAIVESKDITKRENRLNTSKVWKENNRDHCKYLQEQWGIKNQEKRAAQKSRWYVDNYDKQNVLRIKRRQEIRVFIDSLKEGNPCVKCGVIFDPGCTDFHHRDNDKEFNMSAAQRMGLTNEVILEEVSKCDIICATCHREITVLGVKRNITSKRKVWVQEFKRGKVCIDCNESRWALLDFHHINEGDKSFSINVGVKSKSIQAIINEVAKCALVCPNCHRIKYRWSRCK